jgi:hypothetical protein
MPRKNYIQIKASNEEKASWIAQAYLEGKSLSTFIRDKVNSAVSDASVEDLRRSIKELVSTMEANRSESSHLP